MKNRFFVGLAIVATLSVAHMASGMDVVTAPEKKKKNALLHSIELYHSLLNDIAVEEEKLNSGLEKDALALNNLRGEKLEYLRQKHDRLLKYISVEGEDAKDSKIFQECEDSFLARKTVVDKIQSLNSSLSQGVSEDTQELQRKQELERKIVDDESHLLSLFASEQVVLGKCIESFGINELDPYIVSLKSNIANWDPNDDLEDKDQKAGQLESADDRLERAREMVNQGANPFSQPKSFWTIGKKAALVTSFFVFMAAAYAYSKNQVAMPDCLKAFNFSDFLKAFKLA